MNPQIKPRLLLAEDYEDLSKEYFKYLKKAGFDVTLVEDGFDFYSRLKKERFDLIVSDTDLPGACGDEVCKRALEEGLIDENVLILGMSDCKDNQLYWQGIANIGCFYDKVNISEGRIEEKVKQAWRNFNSGGLWREKMPFDKNSMF
jgi:CheY-like chemotaxis protein